MQCLLSCSQLHNVGRADIKCIRHMGISNGLCRYNFNNRPISSHAVREGIESVNIACHYGIGKMFHSTGTDDIAMGGSH